MQLNNQSCAHFAACAAYSAYNAAWPDEAKSLGKTGTKSVFDILPILPAKNALSIKLSSRRRRHRRHKSSFRFGFDYRLETLDFLPHLERAANRYQLMAIHKKPKLHSESEEFEEFCEHSAARSLKSADKTINCSCVFCSFCNILNISESKSDGLTSTANDTAAMNASSTLKPTPQRSDRKLAPLLPVPDL